MRALSGLSRSVRRCEGRTLCDNAPNTPEAGHFLALSRTVRAVCECAGNGSAMRMRAQQEDGELNRDGGEYPQPGTQA